MPRFGKLKGIYFIQVWGEVGGVVIVHIDICKKNSLMEVALASALLLALGGLLLSGSGLLGALCDSCSEGLSGGQALALGESPLFLCGASASGNQIPLEVAALRLIEYGDITFGVESDDEVVLVDGDGGSVLHPSSYGFEVKVVNHDVIGRQFQQGGGGEVVDDPQVSCVLIVHDVLRSSQGRSGDGAVRGYRTSGKDVGVTLQPILQTNSSPQKQLLQPPTGMCYIIICY